jgi:hypothetical protein
VAPSGAGRALVTLDGVPQNDPFGGWVIWSQLPPESLDAVEIVRGAGAGPYGAGALTGVVSLEERSVGLAADLFVAERGGARAAAAGTAGPLFLAGAYERSDGYRPVRGIRAGAAEAPHRPRSRRPFRPLHHRARARVRRRPRQRLQRKPRLRPRRRSRPRRGRLRQPHRRPHRPARLAPAGLGPPQRPVQQLRRHRLRPQRNHPRQQPGRNPRHRPRPERRPPPPPRGLELEAGLDARWAEGETRERFRFMGGQFTRTRVAGGQASVAGAYAEATRLSGPWLLTGGARLDRWTTTDGVRLERDVPDRRPHPRRPPARPRRRGPHRSPRPPPPPRPRPPPPRRRLRRLPPAHAERAAPPLPRRQRPDRSQPRPRTRTPARPRPRASTAAATPSAGAWASGPTGWRTPSPTSRSRRPRDLPPRRLRPRRRRPPRTPQRRHGRTPAASKPKPNAAGTTPRPPRRPRRHRRPRRRRRASPAAHRPPPRPGPGLERHAGLRAQPLAPFALRLDARWESARWEDDANTRRLGAALTLDAGAELPLRPGPGPLPRRRQPAGRRRRNRPHRRRPAQLGPPRTLRLGLRLTR